ncbi:MAG TPA: hypothetical protein VIN61_07820, partial [Gammaproteobacteria bacterium]
MQTPFQERREYVPVASRARILRASVLEGGLHGRARRLVARPRGAKNAAPHVVAGQRGLRSRLESRVRTLR